MRNKEQIYECVRVYASGDIAATELREGEKMSQWLTFNRQFRPQQALFVDGVCQEQGHLTKAKCHSLSKTLHAKRKAK